MKIAIGSDHRGYQYKERIKQILSKKEISYHDYGTYSDESCDYPDFGQKVAQAVGRGEMDRGILICGSGLGMAIVANKFKNVRATLCLNKDMARMAREHNDSNILVLSALFTPQDKLEGIVTIWLHTPFAGGRHEHRINKIKKLEEGNV